MGRQPIDGQAFTVIQIGAVAEYLVAVELMRISEGRLLPFFPMSDDDCVDLIIRDKRTTGAIAIQVKARTTTARGHNRPERGKCTVFEGRAVPDERAGSIVFLGLLMQPDMREIRCSWLIPMDVVNGIANKIKAKGGRWSIGPSCDPLSEDKYTAYRCHEFEDVVEQLEAMFDSMAGKDADGDAA